MEKVPGCELCEKGGDKITVVGPGRCSCPVKGEGHHHYKWLPPSTIVDRFDGRKPNQAFDIDHPPPDLWTAFEHWKEMNSVDYDAMEKESGL